MPHSARVMVSRISIGDNKKMPRPFGWTWRLIVKAVRELPLFIALFGIVHWRLLMLHSAFGGSSSRGCFTTPQRGLLGIIMVFARVVQERASAAIVLRSRPPAHAAFRACPSWAGFLVNIGSNGPRARRLFDILLHGSCGRRFHDWSRLLFMAEHVMLWGWLNGLLFNASG